MSALVQLNGVSKSFIRGKEELQVLDDIDLSIEEGDFFALMGPSGSGKTTLLDAICLALYNTTTGNERQGSEMRCNQAQPDVETFVEFTHGKLFHHFLHLRKLFQ